MNIITSIDHQSPLGASDHDCLLISSQIEAPITAKKHKVTLFNKGRYTEMAEHLERTDWNGIFGQIPDINTAYNNFCNYITELQDIYIPSKLLTPGKRNAPGITHKETDLIRKKHRARQRYMETREQDKWNKYARLLNQVNAACRKSQKNYEESIISTVKENPKRVWRCTKSRSYKEP